MINKTTFNPHKTSSTSKFLHFFRFFVGHLEFLDPDPGHQNQCGFMQIRNTVQSKLKYNYAAFIQNKEAFASLTFWVCVARSRLSMFYKAMFQLKTLFFLRSRHYKKIVERRVVGGREARRVGRGSRWTGRQADR
jgi:hypothetical protein